MKSGVIVRTRSADSSPVQTAQERSLSSRIDAVSSFATINPNFTIQQLADVWATSKGEVGPRERLGLLAACENARYAIRERPEKLCEIVKELVESFSPDLQRLSSKDLNDINLALSRFDLTLPELQRAIGIQASERMDEFIATGQQKALISIAWGLATHRINLPTFFYGLEDAICRDMSQFKLKWVASFIQATEFLSHPHEKVRESFRSEVRQRPDEVAYSECRGVVRSILKDAGVLEQASLPHFIPPTFTSSRADEIFPMLQEIVAVRDLTPIEFRQLAWVTRSLDFNELSIKRLGLLFSVASKDVGASQARMNVLADTLADRMANENVSVKVLLATLRGLERIDLAHTKLLDRIAEKLLASDSRSGASRIARLDVESQGKIGRAFAHLNIFNAKLMGEVKSGFEAASQNETMASLADSLFCLTRFNMVDDAVLRAIAEKLSSSEKTVMPNHATMCASAAAMHGGPHAEEVISRSLSEIEVHSAALPHSQTIQLHHALVASGREVPAWLAGRLNDFSNEQFRQYQLEMVQSRQSQFEQQVFDTLGAMGIEAQRQVAIAGYFIDLVVERNGNRYAIECDGVCFHHRGRSSSDVMLGQSAIKEKVLKRSGYQVVHIMDEEWKALPDKERTLRKVLGFE